MAGNVIGSSDFQGRRERPSMKGGWRDCTGQEVGGPRSLLAFWSGVCQAALENALGSSPPHQGKLGLWENRGASHLGASWESQAPEP